MSSPISANLQSAKIPQKLEKTPEGAKTEVKPNANTVTTGRDLLINN